MITLIIILATLGICRAAYQLGIKRERQRAVWIIRRLVLSTEKYFIRDSAGFETDVTADQIVYLDPRKASFDLYRDGPDIVRSYPGGIGEAPRDVHLHF